MLYRERKSNKQTTKLAKQIISMQNVLKITNILNIFIDKGCLFLQIYLEAMFIYYISGKKGQIIILLDYTCSGVFGVENLSRFDSKHHHTVGVWEVLKQMWFANNSQHDYG